MPISVAERNYTRNTNNYGTAFFEEGAIEHLADECKGDFDLIIVGSEDAERKHYRIPYKTIKHLLTERTIKIQKDGRRRWHIKIKGGRLYIGDESLPIEAFQRLTAP
jgi:hypothetical protein